MHYSKSLTASFFVASIAIGSFSEVTLVVAASTHKFVTQTVPSCLLIKKDGIPGRYIVVFQSQSRDQIEFHNSAISNAVATQYGATIQTLWTHALNGMVVTMNEESAAAMAHDSRVAWIEQDVPVHLIASTFPVIPNELQTPAPWGLDRIDQRELPLDNSYTYANDGVGVTFYSVDTGIRLTHQEFGGRANWGTNVLNDGQDTDCNGHGTATSSIMTGATYGVAKGATIVAVKVMGCEDSGMISDVITGMDWVIANHHVPAVMNISLGADGISNAWNQAITRVTSAGITVAVAAGNGQTDACMVSPGSAPEAITVGGSTQIDTRASFSNWGTCLDLFAPAVSITAADIGSDTDQMTASGTSFSAPYTAGAAALYLHDHPDATPATVAAALIASATPDKIPNAGTGSPNRLLFTDFGAPPYLPDLIIKIVSAGTSAQPGGKLTVSIRTKNQGTARAAASWSTIYLSKDQNVTSTDIAAGAYCDIPELDPGDQFTCTGPITLPSTLARGTYYLGAIADSQQVIPESNENNNGLAASSSTIISNGRFQVLTVARSGNGIGNILSDPTGIDCGTICSTRYIPGTKVTLTATATIGSTFMGWDGACTGIQLTCVLTMNSDQKVTARFQPVKQFALTVVMTPPGAGKINSDPDGIECGRIFCRQIYPAGSTVTLTAKPAAGYNFVGWDWDCQGTDDDCMVKMTTQHTAQAKFVKQP